MKKLLLLLLCVPLIGLGQMDEGRYIFANDGLICELLVEDYGYNIKLEIKNRLTYDTTIHNVEWFRVNRNANPEWTEEDYIKNGWKEEPGWYFFETKNGGYYEFDTPTEGTLVITDEVSDMVLLLVESKVYYENGKLKKYTNYIDGKVLSTDCYNIEGEKIKCKE